LVLVVEIWVFNCSSVAMKLPQKVNIKLESIVYIKFQWASQ